MIPVTPCSDQTIAVFGLGRAGIASARALVAGGARVWAWDDNEQGRAGAEQQGVTLTNLYECDWAHVDALVLSPGVPLTHPEPHPVAKLARAHDCPIIGEVELLGRTMTGARYVGITGTNGKSTTTALIGHVLESAGWPVQVGGNLGVPALALEPLGDDGVYVLEMSSYQLDLTQTLAFDVALWLNVTPDHLDRHGDMAGYVAAKKRIFNGQTATGTAVIGVDDDESRAVRETLMTEGSARVIPISSGQAVNGGVYVDGTRLMDATDGDARTVMDLADAPALPGAHNGQNAAAAYAACRALGVAEDMVVAAIKSFPGLAHRQERVAEKDGVVFINDSKATNAEAAAKALGSYDNIFWIAGGVAKAGGLDAALAHLDGVRRAYLIGAAQDDFAGQLLGRVETVSCGDLKTAVHAAWVDAKGEGAAVILLSPACASFDQYKNFEVRGDAFRDLAMEVAA